ncbi:MAG: hypothetical protein Q9227_009474 [Pyrenula ochraceoflavens]
MADVSSTPTSYYDPTRLIQMAKTSGSQEYSDALAFWNRPEPGRPIYDASEGMNCDEAKPTCDRCKKGARDCVYPEPPGSGKAASRLKHAPKEKQESSSSDEHDDEMKLETIADEDEESLEAPSKGKSPQSDKAPTLSMSRKQSMQSLQRKRGYRHTSESSSTSKDKSLSPSTDASTTFSGSQTPASSLRTLPLSRITPRARRVADSSRWSHLTPSIQDLLQFHEEEISHYHYFLKTDFNDFIHTTFIDLAISYEPLLYAVAGFAAYHRTLRQPDGALKDFLTHYGSAMKLLRKSLSAGQPRTEATLLTILQLATFEEYLGDWINLAGHHRAAHQMFLEMYTPDNIMSTETGRQILGWHSRFDVVVGLLAGSETTLEREWYAASKRWHDEEVERDPFDVVTRIGSLVANYRIMGRDMAVLFGQLSLGKMSMEDFTAEDQKISKHILAMRENIEALNDDDYRVVSFPDAQPTPDDIVNPYAPGGLFREPLFTLNYMWIDWYAMSLMHSYQISSLLQRPLRPELEYFALEQCRLFEAIDHWPESPKGATLGAHASLGIASVFLPKDEKHTMWGRRKLAKLEQMGYSFPMTFRTKMAELWQDPSVKDWWLPNDEENYPLLKSIRAFTQERANVQGTAEQPLDHKSEDLRDMKAIFSKLNIDDSPRSSNSPGGSTGG